MKIGFLLYERALITGISLAAEMLSSAASLRPRALQRSQPFSIKLIAPKLEPTKVTAGLKLQPDITYDDTQAFDILILLLCGEIRNNLFITRRKSFRG